MTIPQLNIMSWGQWRCSLDPKLWKLSVWKSVSPFLTLAFVSSLPRAKVFTSPHLAPHDGLRQYYWHVSHKQYLVLTLSDYLKPRSSVIYSKEISAPWPHNHVYICSKNLWRRRTCCSFSSHIILFASQFKQLFLHAAFLIFIVEICTPSSVSPFGPCTSSCSAIVIGWSISISLPHSVHA